MKCTFRGAEREAIMKRLVIVTTDTEIELAMFVDASKLEPTEQAISEARKKYYEEECGGLFDDILFKTMQEHGIDFEYVEHEEM